MDLGGRRQTSASELHLCQTTEGARKPPNGCVFHRRVRLPITAHHHTDQTDALLAECDAAKEAARAAWKQWMSDFTFRYDETLLDTWRSAWLEAIAERDAMYPTAHPYFEDLLRIRNHVWVS